MKSETKKQTQVICLTVICLLLIISVLYLVKTVFMDRVSFSLNGGVSNGNMINGGRAVISGNCIYAITDNNHTDCFRIESENLNDNSTEVLFLSETFDLYDGSCLNYVNGDLYFIAQTTDNSSGVLVRYSLESRKAEVVFSRAGSLASMMIVNDSIVMSDGSTIYVMDINSGNIQEHAIQGTLLGLMNGELYFHDPDGMIVRFDSRWEKHTVGSEPILRRLHVIPENGLLYVMDNEYNMPAVNVDRFDYSARILILDAITGECVKTVYIPFWCESYFNVSKNYVFVQRYCDDGSGPIYANSIDSDTFECFEPDHYYQRGVTVIEDKPANMICSLIIDYYYEAANCD